MGSQSRVVNMHPTDDHETVDITAVGDVVVEDTSDETTTMIDQDQKVLEKRKATTKMTKTDLRLMNDQDDHTEVVAVDGAEDVVVDEVIRDVEDTFDATVTTTVKVQNTHKTAIVEEMTVSDVAITVMVIDAHDDSADVHDVHHRAPETKVIIATEVSKKNAETATTNVETVITNVEVVADAVDAQDVTSVHVSQEVKAKTQRAVNLNVKINNLNVKINLQMTPHPPPLKLKAVNKNSSSFFNRCVVSFILIATLRTYFFIQNSYLVRR